MNKFLAWAIGMIYAAPEGDAGGGSGAGGGAPGAVSALTQEPGGGTGSGAQPPAGGAPPAGDVWYKDFKDEGLKTWMASLPANAYTNAEAIALKAYNQEKLIGADKAGRSVIVPKPDDKPEVWTDFYKKVGAPEKPEGYKLPETLKPEQAEALGKDELFTKFRGQAHAAGMTQKAFEAVTNWYMGEMAAEEQRQFQQFEADAKKEFEGLKLAEGEGGWGKDYDKNLELSRRALRAFLPYDKNGGQKALDEATAKLMGAFGVKNAYTMLANIGKALVEDDFVLGGGTGQNGEMSAEGAKARIAQLKADPAFQTKFANRDADSIAEWNKLHKIAFPGQQQLRDSPQPGR